jgi:glutamine amidotransferase/cyclase
VNCIDADGSKAGFDVDLMADLCAAVTIPVIASSGAGAPAHFTSVFQATRVEAALAAGIFHRGEVTVPEVKADMVAGGVCTRV